MGGESKRNGRSLGCLFDRFTLKVALAQPEALSYHGPPTFMVAASFGAGPQTDRLTRGTTGFRVASGWERGWRLRFSCCWPSRALQRSSTESADCGVPLGRTGLAQTFRRFDRGLFHPSPLLSSPDLAPGILRASSWPGGGKHGPSSGAVHRTRIPPGGATPVGGAFHFLSADDRKPDKQP